MLRATQVQTLMVRRSPAEEFLESFQNRVNGEIAALEEGGWDILQIDNHFGYDIPDGEFQGFLTVIIYGVRIEKDPSS